MCAFTCERRKMITFSICLSVCYVLSSHTALPSRWGLRCVSWSNISSTHQVTRYATRRPPKTVLTLSNHIQSEVNAGYAKWDVEVENTPKFLYAFQSRATRWWCMVMVVMMLANTLLKSMSLPPPQVLIRWRLLPLSSRPLWHRTICRFLWQSFHK